MNIVQVTSAEDIDSKTTLGQEMSGRIWDALVAGYRTHGKAVRLVTLPDRDIGRPLLGLISATEQVGGDVKQMTLSECHIPYTDEADETRVRAYDESDVVIDVQDEDGYLITIPSLVGTIPQTTLTAVVPETGFSVSKAVSGLDNVPPHLAGRVVTETYPFETRYFVYFNEGARVFERVDDRLRQASTTAIDTETTITVNGDQYAPAVVEDVYDDGIETTHYTLCGDNLIKALGAGAILPSFANEQVPVDDPMHEPLPFNDYEALHILMEQARKEQEEQEQQEQQEAVEGDVSEWDDDFDVGIDSTPDDDEASENPFGQAEDFDAGESTLTEMDGSEEQSETTDDTSGEESETDGESEESDNDFGW